MPDEQRHEPNPAEESVVVTITSAVIDTGFGTAGNFDADRMRGLADRLRAQRIELWVPQQVIWEWAAHAQEDWDKIRREYRKLVLGGFASDQSVSPAGDLVSGLAERVKQTGASVLPTFGASAIQAIRDQVLGTGPGRTEKGVRTGASDSAWIRDAVEQVDGKIRKLVFLSANRKDVLAATRSMGFSDNEVLVAPNERELFGKHIARMVTASLDLTRRVVDMLIDSAAQASSEQALDTHDIHPPWLESSDLNILRDVTERYEWGHVEFREGVEIALPQPQVVEVANVQIDVTDDLAANGSARSLTFDLTLLGGVLLNGYSIEDTGSVAFSENYVGDVLISLSCAVEEIGDRQFSQLRQTDTGSVSSALARFDEQAEALTWTLEYLEALEHVTLERATDQDGFDETADAEDGAIYLLRGPTGQREKITLSRDPFDDEVEWELNFKESSVTVKCSYDHEATAWFDGEAYVLYPAYTVHSPVSREPYSAFAVVWRYLIAETDSSAINDSGDDSSNGTGTSDGSEQNC